MKILITNPDALINFSTGEYYEGIKEIINDFNSVEGQQSIVVSLEKDRLEKIPKSFEPMHVGGRSRMGVRLVDAIKEQLGCDISELFVLGCKKVDVALAANSKLLLLRADYAFEQNAGESIYSNEYGIPIKDANSLKLFLSKFLKITKPWFYKLDVSKQTTIYSLTNANTNQFRSDDIRLIAEKFRNHLKNGDNSFKLEFLTYFLVSTYAIVNELRVVDYWGIYPSSSSSTNEDLEYYKEKARQTYGIRTKEPIFLRNAAAPKRHTKSTADRIATACDDELKTISLNPYYRGKLAGKTVCIIDDFTNIGSSCEAARSLLEFEGVARLVFITLGKFGKTYYSFDYKIKGDPFGAFTFLRGKETELYGEFNNSSDFEFIKSLGEIVK